MREDKTRWTGAAVLASAIMIGAFETGSYVYFRRSSVDFIVAARERQIPTLKIGETVSPSSSKTGIVSGWWAIGEAVCTVNDEATLDLRLVDAPQAGLSFTAIATAFVHERLLPVRTIEVLANGTSLATWRIDRPDWTTHTAKIPGTVVPGDGRIRLTFRLSHLLSPADLRLSGDQRRIGLCLRTWSFARDLP